MDKATIAVGFSCGVAYGVACTLLLLYGRVQRFIEIQEGEYDHLRRQLRLSYDHACADVSHIENDLRETLRGIEAKQRLDYSIAERMSQLWWEC